MAMPKYDDTMLPILKVLEKHKSLSLTKIASELLDGSFFDLTESEKLERVSNGETRFLDRVAWGRTYLKKAGLVAQKFKGAPVEITEEGKNVLKKNLQKLDDAFLMQYPSFAAFKGSPDINKVFVKKSSSEEGFIADNRSPSDLIEAGVNQIKKSLAADLLEKLKTVDPYYFQTILLKLFKKMGYGDVVETSKSGDGGIDGIINQDKLGLEKIYIQAKRYADSKVREPEVRNFIGAMSGDVSKGIFVTTSVFDQGAIEKAKSAHHKIILIDGMRLVELMIENDIGVSTKSTYKVLEIDSDFFEVS